MFQLFNYKKFEYSIVILLTTSYINFILMLIQLELQNFVFKQILPASKQHKQDNNQTQDDSEQLQLEISNNQSKRQKLPQCSCPLKSLSSRNSQENLQKHLKKINSICLDTFASDKIIRLLGSFLKIIKNFNILKDTKFIDKSYMELVQLRRLLRVNRLLSYFKQIIPLSKKKQKKWLDYYNIMFKNLQLILDINDSIGYLQQLNIIDKKRFDPFGIRKRTSNLYFIECLMWLFLNVQDFLKNKNKRSDSQNLRKKMAILKYSLDSFTSYNDFSIRLYTFNAKITTVVGTVSSIVGLWALWL